MSRPAWQSRDTAKRAAAVATGREAALVAELPQIVRNDPEASVRRAALERIDDLTVVADRMSNDADAGIRERARARLVDLLAGKAPVAERRRALGLVEDQGLLEQIAKRAPEVELRRAALERCKRVGFIAERVLEDADADLRIELLARVDQTATLERLAQQARTKDKRLFRAIRERLDAGKLAAGESDTLTAHAESLCAALETHLRHPGADAAAVLARVEPEWAELRARIDDRFDKRFDGALQTLKATIGAIARIGEEPPEPAVIVVETAPAEAVEAAEPVAAAPAPAIDIDAPDPALADLLQRAEELAEAAADFERETLQRRWQQHFALRSPRGDADQAMAASFSQRMQSLQAAAEVRAAKIEQARQVVDQAIAAVDSAIEAGQLSSARAARARARTAVDSLDERSAKELGRKLAGLDPKIDKLAQWQRWSDNKVRVRLCEEAEALIGSGIHPDGLANKIAELKTAWKRIDDSEAEPGAAAPESGLSRRFRFLCHKALEPARGYFEKRKEVRGKRSDELGSFIERVRGELDAPGTETSALIALKREVGERLRRVDEVDPRQRGEIGKQMKQLIEACSAMIDARFNAIAEEKQKLIAQLRRQLTHAELDAALDLAKSAQKRWQTLGKGSQKTDQALWQELRGLIDPLFEKRNDELKAVDAERDAGRASAQALIDEMRALPAGELDATRLESEIVRIENLWRGDAERPRDLERVFDQALTQAHSAVAGRRLGETAARQGKVSDLAAELDAVEAAQARGEAVDALLADLETRVRTLDSAIAAAFTARLLRMRQTEAGVPERICAEQLALGERLALEYEFLAGVESPTSAQSARLNLQVERLAARMSTGISRTPREERMALDLRWWALGPLAPAERERLNGRRQNALSRL
ncbi:MAG TPA: hypothetical protein VN259_00835 [Xanthomonadales bacterium]|nr:hypothetical protein [Xanthomonadales bacterium]